MTGVQTCALPIYTDVFNGIAYDAATGDIYVTGKNWNKVYKVEIFEKEEE